MRMLARARPLRAIRGRTLRDFGTNCRKADDINENYVSQTEVKAEVQ